MLDALFAIPFTLVAVVGLIIYAVMCRLASGERAKAKLWKEQTVGLWCEASHVLLTAMKNEE